MTGSTLSNSNGCPAASVGVSVCGSLHAHSWFGLTFSDQPTHPSHTAAPPPHLTMIMHICPSTCLYTFLHTCLYTVVYTFLYTCLYMAGRCLSSDEQKRAFCVVGITMYVATHASYHATCSIPRNMQHTMQHATCHPNMQHTMHAWYVSCCMACCLMMAMSTNKRANFGSSPNRQTDD